MTSSIANLPSAKQMVVYCVQANEEVLLATLRATKEEVVRRLEAHDAILSVDHRVIGPGPDSAYTRIEIAFILYLKDDAKIGTRMFLSLLDPVEDMLAAMDRWCRRTIWRTDIGVELSKTSRWLNDR